jgi:hypothetical protein
MFETGPIADTLTPVLQMHYGFSMKDKERFEEQFADDAVLLFNGPKPLKIKGKANIVKYHEDAFDDPKARVMLKKYVVDGSQVAVQVDYVSTDPKTGEERLMDESAIFEVRDSKIQKAFVYRFDEKFFY